MALQGVYWLVEKENAGKVAYKFPDPQGSALVYQENKYRGFDIHVVRNGASTGKLTDHAWIVDVTNNGVTDVNTTWPVTAALSEGVITSVSCVPKLKNALAHVQPTESDPPFSINGVTINQRTGEVIASPLGGGASDQMKNFNFLLNIEVTGAGGTVASAKVRIHVHDSLNEVWISPGTYTAVAGSTGLTYRLSAYALFSDGIMADITDHPGLIWSSSNPAHVPFNVGSSLMKMNERNGIFYAQYSNISGASNASDVTLKIEDGSLLNQTGSHIITPLCSVTVLDRWQVPLEPDDKPVAKYIGGPGKGKVDEVSNFLFIAEGCKSEYEGNFKKMVKNIRRDIKSKNSTFPWNLLSKQFNFWTLFMPSQEGAVSIINELVPIDTIESDSNDVDYSGSYYSGGVESTPNPNTWEYKFLQQKQDQSGSREYKYTEQKLVLWRGINKYISDVDELLEYGGHASIWEYYVKDESKSLLDKANRYHSSFPPTPLVRPGDPLQPGGIDNFVIDMINTVGYPTVHDEALTYAQLITKWDLLYDHSLVIGTATIDNLKEIVVDAWKKLANRKLAEKKDTILGIQYGQLPSATADILTLGGDERIPRYGKFSRSQLDFLLQNIYLESNSGNSTLTWSDKINNPDDAVWGTNVTNLGKDFSRTIIISASTRYGGVQYQAFDDANDRRFIGKGISVNLSGSSNINLTQSGSKYIIDEVPFPNKTGLDVFNTITHEIVHSFNLGDEYAEGITPFEEGSTTDFDIPTLKSKNLDMESDVLVDKVDGAGDSLVNRGEIDPDKIKWRWLRIENAGVLTTNVTKNVDEYTFELPKDHLDGFSEGDFVFLRKQSLGKVGQLVDEMGGETTDLSNQLPSSQYSPKLEITNIQSSGTIVATGLNFTRYDEFTSGSVLVKLIPSEVVGKGTITVSGTNHDTVSGTGTFFEAQVNPKSTTTDMTGGSFLRVNIAGNVEVKRVKKVTANDALVLADGFSADVTDADYEIIQRDADSTAPDSYKELLNFAIRNTMKRVGNKKPMTKYPFVKWDPKVDGGGDQSFLASQLTVDGTNSVFSLINTDDDVPEALHKNIVGLYRNGQEYSHGIFHPTGYCHMRSSHGKSSENRKSKKAGEARLLCPVCRYVLIDTIDPSLHDELEKKNNSIYPKI